MAKLFTQLLDAPIEAPRALMDRGKISDTRVWTVVNLLKCQNLQFAGMLTHDAGPQP